MVQVKQCSDSSSSEALSTNALMAVLSTIMGLLAGLLLIRGLHRRLSGANTTNPIVGIFLWAVFALFLPLTSYMFSEAKNSPHKLHRRLILLWMLLAELLRKKLDCVSTINASPLQGVNKQSTWDAINQIVHIAWIGYLIYQYELAVILVVLWAFSIIKVAHRVAAVEVAKRSFALGENSHLVAGYMRQLFPPAAEEEEEEETGGEDRNVMTECEYVIMREEKEKRELGPHGYSLQLPDDKEKEKMVTVGEVWGLAESKDALFAPLPPTPKYLCLPSVLWKLLRRRYNKYPLEDLCLSFALYKLLRRRFEDYPSAEAGSRKSLQFLLRGLLKLSDDKDKDKGGDMDKDKDKDKGERYMCFRVKDRNKEGHKDKNKGERVFRVIGEELNFLRDYYFSTIPLMLSNLWFFLLNCVLMLVIPLSSCIVILYFTYVYFFVRSSPHAVITSFHQLKNSVRVNTVYDLIVTLLLIVTLFLLEFAEAVAYVLSDWVMVSLLCTYAKKQSWRGSPSVRWALTTLRGVKTLLKQPKLKFYQHSVLEPRGRTLRILSQLVQPHRFQRVQSLLLKLVLYRRFLGVQSTLVPNEVKAAIVKYLVDNGGRGPVPPIGESVLQQNGSLGVKLLWACKSDGAAETIIVWHIATCLYEKKSSPSSLPSPQQRQLSDNEQANRRIAETLSKYCAYLVALAPDLLPDDAAATLTTYEAAVEEIQDAILKGHSRKACDFESVTSIGDMNGTAAKRGAELGHQLVAAEWDEQVVWKVLAELWTEIMLYIAPSDDVKSHAQALANRGEFITHIWALLSHGGILRWPTAAPPPPPDQPPV